MRYVEALHRTVPLTCQTSGSGENESILWSDQSRCRRQSGFKLGRLGRGIHNFAEGYNSSGNKLRRMSHRIKSGMPRIVRNYEKNHHLETGKYIQFHNHKSMEMWPERRGTWKFLTSYKLFFFSSCKDVGLYLLTCSCIH